MRTIWAMLMAMICLAGVARAELVYVTTVKAGATLVYVTTNPAEATVRVKRTTNKAQAIARKDYWYFTTNQAEADLKVYYTTNKAEADVKVYFE